MFGASVRLLMSLRSTLMERSIFLERKFNNWFKFVIYMEEIFSCSNVIIPQKRGVFISFFFCNISICIMYQRIRILKNCSILKSQNFIKPKYVQNTYSNNIVLRYEIVMKYFTK